MRDIRAMTAPLVSGTPSLCDLRRERLDGHDSSDRSPMDFAELHQIVGHVLRQIARDGEADALIAAALAEDAGVDADELAAGC